VGIDFGTTTTVVATGRGGEASLVKNQQGDDILPSMVAFTPSGRLLVGRPARARRIIDPQNTLYSVKRLIGRPWMSEEVAEFRRAYPFELERGSDSLPRFVTRVGALTAVEVAAHILCAIRDMLPSASDQDVCLTVPASFDDNQRAAMVDAAERAGFHDVKLLDEPHAAALAYRQYLAHVRTVAVYDLGGGTFDVAVLSVDGDRGQVRAAGGDSYLGGDDIDNALANWAAARILTEFRWDVKTGSSSYRALVHACERAKIRLSAMTDTSIPLGQVDPVLQGRDLRIERARVEGLCRNLMQRTFLVCDEVLSRAGVASDAIDAVILAGGGCYMPMVFDGVRHYFGREPLASLPPDHLVAMGAATWD
jgi:molecular chaperone DnaK (HSP70)